MEKEKSRYPGQPRDEITKITIYKHFMSITPVLFGMLLVALILIAAVVYLNNNTYIFEQYVGGGIVGLVGFLSLLFILLLILATIWIWRRNKIIITTNHIVDIDQIGLFNRTISTLHLDEIQDISAKVSGPLQTILKYGTIIVQTAGERENFVFDFVPRPYELENYILDCRKSVKNHKNETSKDLVEAKNFE